MPNVNKKYLEEEIQEQAWKQLLCSARSGKAMRKLLKKWFTATELTMIEKRLAIAYLLKEKTAYRKIGQLLDVSPATISFIRQGLKRKKSNKK